MKIDIIGSKFSRKLTEFKNFGFDVNNIVEGQSILSLLSKPYETTMKELNTTDLNDITVAYRDLNKLLYPEIKKSKSEIIMLDLLSELNALVEYEGNYYNDSSFELLDFKPKVNNLSTIQKFRSLLKNINYFYELLDKYEKVIIIKILPSNKEEKSFINSLYKLLEAKIDHKLIVTIDDYTLDSNITAPIELYSDVNQEIKKFSSDNYYNQLLFDEKIVDDTLSVYINHIEEREYTFELYKDGKPYKKSNPTTSRHFQFKLVEHGKYRIRVTVLNSSINPRFSKTYKFSNDNLVIESSYSKNYIEIPEKNNLWMLDLILNNRNYEGLIGDAYQYPFGYLDHPVYLKKEINQDFLTKDKLLPIALDIISNMSDETFNDFIQQYEKGHIKSNPLYIEFLKFMQKKEE